MRTNRIDRLEDVLDSLPDKYILNGKFHIENETPFFTGEDARCVYVNKHHEP